MSTDKGTSPAADAAMESKDDTELFTKVKSKKTQKRKRGQDGVDMDTAEPVPSKRPQFPPISGDKLKVTTVWFHVLHVSFQYHLNLISFYVMLVIIKQL